ncbi:MAG: multicomponent Na+:H+ antiporter subunit D [Cycloclasticus pugetii]|jgi:multicomponent Na+:H+ antiporter subunit D|uniref:Formate hydrogenlyase subunit 3/Multisubunit Na+/H+ antiporter, MnhD subunit n=1 Tax=Cycloclasticus zancles 78-ME TaxID=1198232 RepID=S5TY50_9GAMM|nr:MULTISPECIES: monovalent cation/H+ antiporter subunit D family protein [Cycloclasticus]AGS40100.1 Formate hydrogenlyase subunit 3/Multisubunit Na+/H+ antiporter, MnhD subunit [Cycloclasticus zancles 78-ME]MDF1829302.1 monovalent cation/H+ antiporter subunit D family protein [Cycloclasticus pugetii]PHR52067.1 MAG: monovalent cation/H+ antiporter subunit D family protein [Cycloclasticus sp.]
MIESHLSLLLVVLPLMAAPIIAVLPNGRLPWAVSTIVSWSVFYMAAWQLINVSTGHTISYELGGWAPPWGIEYRIDAANALVALVVSGIAALTLPYALKSVIKEIPEKQHALFYTAFMLCLTGLLGIAQTGDIFNLFVFLEISSLSSYALISLGRQRQALTAAYQYLIMGTIGATFFIIGVGLLYAMTGTLNMADLSQRLPELYNHRTIHTAFAFIMVGFALKLALFPLHLWLPNAYTYAPTVVSIFLAATATKVAVYVMLRMVFSVFGFSFIENTPADELFILLCVMGILSMSFYAIYQKDSKRLLAYSSVAQIGYMMLGIGLGSVLGVTATMVHLFNHALMKGALFMAIGALVYRVSSSRLEHFSGLGKQMPWTFGAIVIGGLSLIGVPGTAGFISKWYLVLAAIEKQNWFIVGVILTGSLLAVVYVWKLVEVLYFKVADKPQQGQISATEAPLMMLIPMWVLVLANVYFGFNTELTVGTAEQAVKLLLPGASE